MDRPPGIHHVPMTFANNRRLAVPQRPQAGHAGPSHSGGPPLSPRASNTAAPSYTQYMATPSPPPLSPSPLGSPMSRQSSIQSGSLGVLSTPAIEADNPHVASDEQVDLGSPERAPPPKLSQGEPPTAPLWAAIERLSKQCDEHQLRFRASKHRIFSEFPQILSRLAELDNRAEVSCYTDERQADDQQCTAELFAAINESQPELKARLEKVLQRRRENVDEMRVRTTPWVDFLPDDEEDDLELLSAKEGATAMVRRESGKIERVKGANATNVDSDALAMIERWAEEVKMHLADEIGRLRTQLGEEKRRAYILYRLLGLMLFCVFMLGVFYLIAKAGERGRALTTA
ncbi:hypothetical protein A1Q1_00726 [Trichosporon asahii var. asahii CBS 2479]|uniref:Uncharacterized protein n=1 Tax=Trichosporon asahii var. asahii (strain ATCC 90039 / CBS 2479 / JCM 2466 / KCTC 7840 / NBRC 103889/ NCYC 2677 / UAMH 7654) TaxID=1186058 RepID=J5TB58_TRIAS|nr:hypothetical protein A1Q1_00726 [Trichosporon asahii var. asahii CBS 2479]EJT50071.1 hypothetical protein A1Q1_00726 [Trichosporon asahii var. asahii CBS 2479]